MTGKEIAERLDNSEAEKSVTLTLLCPNGNQAHVPVDKNDTSFAFGEFPTTETGHTISETEHEGLFVHPDSLTKEQLEY